MGIGCSKQLKTGQKEFQKPRDQSGLFCFRRSYFKLRHYHPAPFLAFLRKNGSGPFSLDLTQEACLRLLHASRSNRVDNPRAYLYQIANRLLWQHYTCRPKIIDTHMDIDALPAPQSPLEEAVMAQTRQALVQQARRALSPKCQTAIVLRWRHGLPVAEIAKRMNLSRGMVKKYLASGLAHFRRRLRRFALADTSA